VLRQRILVVEDEPEIADVICAYLIGEGFDTEWQKDGASAIEAAARECPALLLLDVGLPDLTGFEVYRRIVRNGNVPTIFLTARAEEVDRIVGLEMGADDYIVKPFSPRELAARVRAVLRRNVPREDIADVDALRIHDIVIDLRAHVVTRAASGIDLTPAEFRILVALAEEPGRVFTRSQLLDKLDDDGSIFERSLDRHINNLRRKLEPDSAEPIYILTVFGVGYKMRK